MESIPCPILLVADVLFTLPTLLHFGHWFYSLSQVKMDEIVSPRCHDPAFCTQKSRFNRVIVINLVRVAVGLPHQRHTRLVQKMWTVFFLFSSLALNQPPVNSDATAARKPCRWRDSSRPRSFRFFFSVSERRQECVPLRKYFFSFLLYYTPPPFQVPHLLFRLASIA